MAHAGLFDGVHKGVPDAVIVHGLAALLALVGAAHRHRLSLSSRHIVQEVHGVGDFVGIVPDAPSHAQVEHLAQPVALLRGAVDLQGSPRCLIGPLRCVPGRRFDQPAVVRDALGDARVHLPADFREVLQRHFLRQRVPGVIRQGLHDHD